MRGKQLEVLMSEAWFTGFTVGVSQDHPMHLYLIAKSGDEQFRSVSLLLVENTNFFALFGETASADSYLFHSMRGLVSGELKHKDLPQYLNQNIFNQKFPRGQKRLSLARKLTSHLIPKWVRVISMLCPWLTRSRPSALFVP
jgi:hypothetical protein